MNLEAVVDMIVDVMIARENDGKEFGVIVLAEGLAQFMPAKYLEGVTFDDHGNISLSQTELARNMTKLVEAEYQHRKGKNGESPACSLATRPAAHCRTRSTSFWAASSASVPAGPWSKITWTAFSSRCRASST